MSEKPLVADNADYGSLNVHKVPPKQYDDDDNAGDDDSTMQDYESVAMLTKEEQEGLSGDDVYFLLFRLKERIIELTDQEILQITDDGDIDLEIKIDSQEKTQKGYGHCRDIEEDYNSEQDNNEDNKEDKKYKVSIRGVYRMIYESKDQRPKSIQFKVGNGEWSEAINLQQILANSQSIELSKSSEIKERRHYEAKECDTKNGYKYEIFEELIVAYSDYNMFPDQRQCAKLLNYGFSEFDDIQKKCIGDDWKEVEVTKAMPIYIQTEKDGPIKRKEMEKENIVLCERRRNMQIYLCPFVDEDEVINKTVYGVNNETVKNSKTLCGDGEYRELMEFIYGGIPNDMFQPFYYQNVTEPMYICSRYLWIKNKCIYGQDDEFNIFRSLCFVSPENEHEAAKRLSLGILCTILQIALALGIGYEVVRGWDIEVMFENEPVIMVISFLTFSFISYTFLATVNCFFDFYENMHYVCYVSWWIIILDFISNMLIGFSVCVFSFFYLLQSETIGDVVLNSFALTFIIELDDMANIFEADEDTLIEADWKNLEFGDWDSKIGKRRITPFRNLYTEYDEDEEDQYGTDKKSKKTKQQKKLIWYQQVIPNVIFGVLSSPLRILWAFGRIIYRTFKYGKIRISEHKYHQD